MDSKLRQGGYALALFVAAAGSLVLEIVGGRLLAPYVGMSLYTWTAIIAVVLAGLSIGHWIGGHLAEREDGACLRAAARAFWLAALATGGLLALLRMVSGPILAAGLGAIPSIVLLTGAILLLPVLFAGLVAPILTRLALSEAPGSRGRILGRMYAIGALGSIAGTLATGYLFISWIGSTGTVLVVAAAYALAGTGLLLLGRRPARRTLSETLAGLALLAGILFFGARLEALDSPCQVESDYYCIRVVDFAAETGRPSGLMVLDHLGHGINDRDDPTLLHSSYVELADRLLARRKPPGGGLDGFFVGGGAYSLPRAWLATYPGANLLVAEIDPAVTETARRHLWLTSSPGLSVRHEDARVVLQSLPREPLFDVVLGDAFHDISIPAHLITLEFAREIRARLRQSGIYLLNVVDAARRPAFLLSQVRTLRRAFPVVEVWADAEQMAGGGRVTYLVLSGDRETDRKRLFSQRDPGRFWVRWPTDRLSSAIAAAGVPVLSDDYAPVERLLGLTNDASPVF